MNMNLLQRMKVIFDMVKPPIPKVRRDLGTPPEWKRLRTSKFGEDMKWGYWIKKTQIHYDDNMEIIVYPHIIAYEFWEDQPFCHAITHKEFLNDELRKNRDPTMSDPNASICAFIDRCKANNFTT